MNQTIFRNDAHAQGFAQLIARDKTPLDDRERRALFFCLSALEGLMRNAGVIYDFKARSFNMAILEKMPFSSGEQALVRLGFNLYSGGVEYQKGRSTKKLDCDVMGMIKSMDAELVTVVLNAIRIRKGMA